MKYEERINTEMEDAFGNAPFEMDFDTKQKLRNEEPMILVSQVAFMNSKEGYLVAKGSPVSSEWLIAVHVMVASFTGTQYNIKGKEIPYRTHPFNIDMICTLLNFDGRTSARQKKKIGQALEALCEKGILSVETLDGSEVDFTDYKKLFIAEQSLATMVRKEKDGSGQVIKEHVSIERAHLSLPRHALVKITQEINESNVKPDEVVKLIATYASVITNINKSVVNTKIEDGVEILDLPSEAQNYALMNATKDYLSPAGLELISSRMGISPTTASDRIKRLCEMRILFAVKVKHPNMYEKHTYCKFEHVDMMLRYYKAMIMSNSNKDYEQLISIRSAYGIEYEGAEDSSETTQTPSETVTEPTQTIVSTDTEIAHESNLEDVETTQINNRKQDTIIRWNSEKDEEQAFWDEYMDTVTDKDNEYSFNESDNPWSNII